MSKQQSNIGLCGGGVMGRRIVEALVAAGHSVVAYDVSESARRQVEKLGAEMSESPAAVMQTCSTVILVLPAPEHVRDCVTGEEGLLSRPIDHPDAAKTIVDMSTVDPDVSIEMSQTAKSARVAYLDAPILGRPDTVGNWALPVGGSPEDLAVVRPVLEVLASQIFEAGGVGAGNRIKLLNQLMFGAINAMTAEMMAIADRMGVSQRALYETITGSKAGTVSNLFKELGSRVVDERYTEPTFTVDLLVKDVRLASKMSREAGAPPLLSKAVEFINEAAQTAGYGQMDTSVMWKAVAGFWGTTVKEDSQ